MDGMIAAATRTPSTCWECSTLCGSIVTVENGRAVRVDPNPAHPASHGAFCVKGIRGLKELTYGENRLLHPLRRTGPRGSGAFERIDWDTAFEDIATRLDDTRRRHGPEAIVGAVSGAFYSRGLVMALMMRSIGSPNWMINQDLCGGCRGVSDMVTGLGITGGEDLENTGCALLVGTNPHIANPIAWMALKAAKRRGARIIVIDPVRTASAELADLWLAPRIGTDAAIALAMIDVLITENRYDRAFVAQWCHGFDALAERARACPPSRAAEISGVPEATIVAAARMYADGPAAFVSGHGTDAITNGVQTFRAFHALVAIAGNVDRVGGNRRAKKPGAFKTFIELLHDPRFRLPPEIEARTLGAEQFPLWSGPQGWQTACHNPTVFRAILTGDPYPVRAMVISGVNIAVTYPDTARTLAALKSLDHLVVAAHSMNPTAALADIVLPKTTALEEAEIALHQSGPCLSYTAPAIARQGEAKPDIEIAAGILDRLRARGALTAELLPWSTQDALNRFQLEGTGIDLDKLASDGFATFPFSLADFERQGFRTSTGRVELYSERMAALGLDPLPAYKAPDAASGLCAAFPLLLQTGQREKTYHHSRFRDQAWAKKVSPDPLVQISPRTAARHSVAEGQWVLVELAGGPGSCRLKVHLSAAVPDDVLVTGMGWWRPDDEASGFGALDININAALGYGGPYDPASGSPDLRMLPCRMTVLAEAAA
jgi:anaerobic selenocysteine-containing dehydrogenase